MRKNVIFVWTVLTLTIAGIWVIKRGFDEIGYRMNRPTAQEIEERRIIDSCLPKLTPPVAELGSKKWTQTALQCFKVHEHEQDAAGTQAAKQELEQERAEAASDSGSDDP
jgi:hypothetical protein